MSDPSAPALHPCTLCTMLTSTRCSGCKELFFCSKEHQKLLWPMHKVFCGKDDPTFFLPSLSDLERSHLEQVRDIPYVISVLDPAPASLLAFVKQRGLFSGSWQELLDVLTSEAPSLPLWQITALRCAAHTQICCNMLSLPTKPSPWRLLAVPCSYLFLFKSFEQVAPEQRPALLARASPYLKQFAVHATLQASRAHKRLCDAEILTPELLKVSLDRLEPLLEGAAAAESTRRYLKLQLASHQEALPKTQQQVYIPDE
ncbi:hypothetical protein JCM8097_008519 [Rhodosporidiobolus ruineniae]